MGNRMLVQNTKTKTTNTKLHSTNRNRNSTRHIRHLPNLQPIQLLQNLFKPTNQQSKKTTRKQRLLRRRSIQPHQQNKNIHLEPLLNPSKIKKFMKNIIEKCTQGPNKVDKPRQYERKKKSKK